MCVCVCLVHVLLTTTTCYIFMIIKFFSLPGTFICIRFQMIEKFTPTGFQLYQLIRGIVRIVCLFSIWVWYLFCWRGLLFVDVLRLARRLLKILNMSILLLNAISFIFSSFFLIMMALKIKSRFCFYTITQGWPQWSRLIPFKILHFTPDKIFC